MKMKKAVLTVAAFLALGGSAFAQQAIAVDINRAKLVWTWEPDLDITSGTITAFLVQCGAASGTTDKATGTDPAQREIPIADVISGTGVQFCRVLAGNTFGLSEPSNEVNFVAGAAPKGLLSVTLQAR